MAGLFDTLRDLKERLLPPDVLGKQRGALIGDYMVAAKLVSRSEMEAVFAQQETLKKQNPPVQKAIGKLAVEMFGEGRFTESTVDALLTLQAAHKLEKLAENPKTAKPLSENKALQYLDKAPPRLAKLQALEAFAGAYLHAGGTEIQAIQGLAAAAMQEANEELASQAKEARALRGFAKKVARNLGSTPSSEALEASATGLIRIAFAGELTRALQDPAKLAAAAGACLPDGTIDASVLAEATGLTALVNAARLVLGNDHAAQINALLVDTAQHTGVAEKLKETAKTTPPPEKALPATTPGTPQDGRLTGALERVQGLFGGMKK